MSEFYNTEFNTSNLNSIHDYPPIKKNLVGNFVEYGINKSETSTGLIIDKIMMLVSNKNTDVAGTGYLIIDDKTKEIVQVQNWRILKILK